MALLRFDITFTKDIMVMDFSQYSRSVCHYILELCMRNKKKKTTKTVCHDDDLFISHHRLAQLWLQFIGRLLLCRLGPKIWRICFWISRYAFILTLFEKQSYYVKYFLRRAIVHYILNVLMFFLFWRLQLYMGKCWSNRFWVHSRSSYKKQQRWGGQWWRGDTS